MTLLLNTVSAWTVPLNLDIPALTVSIDVDTSTGPPLLMVTLAEAFTVMPLDSMRTLLPLLP